MALQISKTVHSHDGFTLSALVTDGKSSGFLESKRYIGYSDREARKLFRQHLKDNGLKSID